jgi:hypothetical protein
MLIVRRSSLAALCPVLTSLFVMACGGSDGSAVEGGNGNGNGASSSGGSGLSLGGGGPGPGSDSGTGGSRTTPITPGSECAKGTAAADAIPAVVQMVIDISGSMAFGADGDEDPSFGESKWDITSGALHDAVEKLPASVALGLNFYPNVDIFFGDDECINNHVDLPIALLGEANSRQRRNFNNAIDSAFPYGGTPTHGAFIFGADTVKSSKLAGKKFVLLITDGVPTYNLDCTGDGDKAVANAPLIAAVAATHDADAVSTFVIGSPGSEEARGDLSQMASKGGTAKPGCSDAGPDYCHLDMTTADDFAAALASGLAEVAGAIGTCEYAVPSPPTGLELDTSLVNVLYTKGDGSQASIPQDAVGDCKSGWQYDDPTGPSKITLCGADCDAVKADQGAKIDVIFGCKTETNVPVK